jgi:septal ring factor EnvC (AmiA/AmiB activator)
MSVDPVVPLDDLARRIDQQQAELEALRSEYEARQAQLTDLATRKQQLEDQLRQVEAEIRAVSQGAVPNKPQAPKAKEAQAPNRSPLPELILEVVRGASGPVTVKVLTEEVEKRGYTGSSRNLANLVKFHVRQLKKKGRLAPVKGQPGYVLAHADNGRGGPAKTSQPTKPRKSEVPQPTTATKKSQGEAARPARGNILGKRGQQPPLRVVLTGLLQKARQPLTGGELAEQVTATGYQTRSKSLKDNVWAMLTVMDNVEHLPGQGYRLKKKA